MNIGPEGRGGLLQEQYSRRELLKRGAILVGASTFLEKIGRAKEALADEELQYLDVEIFFSNKEVISIEPRLTRWREDTSLKSHFYVPLSPDNEFMTGFLVRNDAKAPMWKLLKEAGGTDRIGYPISNRVVSAGITQQAFQRGVLLYHHDYNSGEFLTHSEAPTGFDPIPLSAFTPNYLRLESVPEGMWAQIGGDGFRIENWQKAADLYGKPIWDLMRETQGKYHKTTGNYLPIPGIHDTETWNTWANQANLPTPELLQQVFFANSPTNEDGSVEQKALIAVNKKRAEIGLPPFESHPLAVKAARSQAIYGLINDERFRTEGDNIHWPEKRWVGHTGVKPTDRVRYWGGGPNTYCTEVLGASPGPTAAIDDLWASEAHHRILTENHKHFGYAEASVCWPRDYWVLEFREDVAVLGQIS